MNIETLLRIEIGEMFELFAEWNRVRGKYSLSTVITLNVN